MANTTTTYQCPSCNGRLFFNGNVGKLQCEFCDSTYTVEEVERLYAQKQAQADSKAAAGRLKEFGLDTGSMTQQQLKAAEAALLSAQEKGLSAEEQQNAIMQTISAATQQVQASAPSAAEASTSAATHVDVAPIQSSGDPIQDYLARAKWNDPESEMMRAYNCPACGAQLMVDPVTAVTSCPYCGNNAVIPGQLSDLLKPDLIIPFKVDKQSAIKALKKYYEGKKFLPNTFTDGNHIEEIQGVYVPFWLYTGTGTGDATFNATNTRTWTDLKNSYTATDHFILTRVGTMEFEKIPVDGSTKMPDAHMDAIEPYDYSELVPFSVAYLPGYITERYDQDAQKCEKRANKRAENSCIDAIEDTAAGYMTIEMANARAGIEWSNISYALLPVWMLHTKWDGQDFLFAMNGQTGRFIGDLPIDNGKVRKRFITIFLPIAIIIAVILIFVLGL